MSGSVFKSFESGSRRFAALCAMLVAIAMGASANTQAAEGEANVSEAQAKGVAQIDEFIAKQGIDKSSSGWKSGLSKPPEVAFDSAKTYYWVLDTNVGTMKIKLMPDVAPMHVTSTIYLTRLGFYDDVVFHRVIDGFMAQGGDPTGTGRGGPGYKYAGEFDPEVKHDRGSLLSMANAGPGTDGSQFFLTFTATPHLNGKHTIFGEVVAGMKVVEALESQGSSRGKTKEKLDMVKSTITVVAKKKQAEK